MKTDSNLNRKTEKPTKLRMYHVDKRFELETQGYIHEWCKTISLGITIIQEQLIWIRSLPFGIHYQIGNALANEPTPKTN